MKLFKRGSVIILMWVSLLGCDDIPVITDEEAQLLVQNYLTAVREGRYDDAFKYCANDFLQVRGNDGWKAFYQTVTTQLGEIVEMKMKKKQADDRLSARFFIYQFKSKYEKGLATETVTMLQKFNGNEPLKIYAHKIESSKLRR